MGNETGLWLELLQRLQGRLSALKEKSRLRTWPSGAPLKIQVFCTAGDEGRQADFSDAAQTFHPGSELRIETASSVASPPGERFDVAVLLHPWPDGGSGALRRLAPVRRAFTRSLARRKWILFSDRTLWDGALWPRLPRRLIDVALNPLQRWLARLEGNRLARLVLPRLAAARRWKGEIPCAHSQAIPLFRRPRPVAFCPECGMGVPLPGAVRIAPPIGETYGPGYARHYQHIGDAGWQRYVDYCVERAKRNIQALGFNERDAASGVPARVLDYGCGNGRFARLWLERGWDYVGADPSPANLEFAREWHAANPFPVTPVPLFVHGELGAPGVAAGAPYGAIFLSHVLEHVPEPAALLADLRRLAADAGWLILEVPSAEHYAWSSRHRGYRNIEHLWDFTPAALEAMARAAGWSSVHTALDADPANEPYFVLAARNGAPR